MFLPRRTNEKDAKLAAIDRVQAVIEFDLHGNILAANENFLSTVGYGLSEIVGRHHGIFVEPAVRESHEYKSFWERLGRGEFQAGQFQRVGKGGKPIWIEASYNPLLGRDGKPYRVVKFATDITRQKSEDADRAGQIAAIGKSQGVISFDPDGNILDANENFLAVVGYSLAEIQGRHHGMFVEPGYRLSDEYAQFWAALKRGTYQSAQFKRIGKGGRTIWIQASYNPIFDASGRPYKVVKFCTDITQQVTLLSDLRLLIDRNFGAIDEAVGRSAEQSDSALDGARSASASVQTMAAAAEELAASVSEVSQSMTTSQAATDDAFARVREAGDHAARLSEAARAMTNIVALISTIASQINLLALNATIESARAGAAGRGFAVVAQEVKNLANQATKATGQIQAEIEGIQTVSGDVVTALDAIRGSVDIVRNHVVATSAAVEEQTAVTRDMSANMQQAARAVGAISESMSAIASAVQDVSGAVGETRKAAQVLAR